MSLVPFTFKNVELKVVTINGNPWTRAKEVRKALEYNKKTAHVIIAHVSAENYAQKYDLTKVPTAGNLLNWPSDSRNSTSMKKGCMRCCFLVNSRWQESSENTVVMSCFRT